MTSPSRQKQSAGSMSKMKTDTSLWLHNKLGNVNDLWSSGSICSQLSLEVLKNIQDCFADLQALVKVKLLIAFLHIPRRNVDEVSPPALLGRSITLRGRACIHHSASITNL